MEGAKHAHMTNEQSAEGSALKGQHSTAQGNALGINV